MYWVCTIFVRNKLFDRLVYVWFDIFLNVLFNINICKILSDVFIKIIKVFKKNL